MSTRGELLVFDEKLTTHRHLAELGVEVIALRRRDPKLIDALQAGGATRFVRIA